MGLFKKSPFGVEADNIYLSNGSGFDIYYYSTGGFFGVGWRKVGSTNTNFANQPIFLTDGFYILRRGADLNLVHTGAVKTNSTNLAITEQFTLVSGVFPVGSTLASSNLQAGLQGGDSASVSDQVLIQNQTTGGFDIYYYSTGGFFGIGWRKVGATNVDQSAVAIPSSIIIKRLSDTDFNLQMTRPAGYENL